MASATAPDFTTLGQYYGYRDVFALYDNDEDAVVDAWVDGSMPIAVRRAVEETVSPTTLQIWLLRRMIRLQGQALKVLEVLATDPTLEP